MRKMSMAVLGILLVSAPLLAHHGAAALDTGKEVTLKGTVTEWIWSNPHCFLQFDAKDDTGKVRNWAVETQNPTAMTQRGWSRTSFTAGDEVTVILEPVMALEVSPDALQALGSLSDIVTAIHHDRPQRPALAQSVPLIRANSMWAATVDGVNIDGRGQIVVILDSGVEKDQPVRGQGGPARPVDSAAALAALVAKTERLEREMRDYEDLLRRRGMTPSIWPVSGKLESGMGGRRNPFGGRGFEYHEGQDIDAVYGTPVMVAASGTVTIAGRERGYGNVIYVDHGAGLSTRYGHLSQIDVKIGQTVTRGQTIGLVGSTGRSTGPHLHYEVRINNQPVDPRQYLPGAER